MVEFSEWYMPFESDCIHYTISFNIYYACKYTDSAEMTVRNFSLMIMHKETHFD